LEALPPPRSTVGARHPRCTSRFIPLAHLIIKSFFRFSNFISFLFLMAIYFSIFRRLWIIFFLLYQ
jgi:hypothetical protein